jgi:hypothetical protein
MPQCEGFVTENQVAKNAMLKKEAVAAFVDQNPTLSGRNFKD